MANKLTEAEISELKVIFFLFNKDRVGKLTPKQLGTIMRAIAKNPTVEELKTALNEMTAGAIGTIDISKFLSFVAQKSRNKDRVKEIRNAFCVFDKEGKGFLTAADLRQVVANAGQEFSDSKDGQIHYDALVVKLLEEVSLWDDLRS